MNSGKKVWRLGQTSARYESGGRGAGTVSHDRYDHGGASYGTYQLATKPGTLDHYLRESKFRAEFEGLTPGTPQFDDAWRRVALNVDFEDEQHKFIRDTHYLPQVEKLKQKGLDLIDRGMAVHDAIWSTAVQTSNLTAKIFHEGLIEKFGKNYDVSKLTDKDIVEAIQDYKHDHTEQIFRSSPKRWESLKQRALEEKAALSSLAVMDQEVTSDHVPYLKNTVDGNGAVTSRSRSVLRLGMRGQDVEELQSNLSKLDATDENFCPVKIDGAFGQHTKAALESFQRVQNLVPDGIAGPKTQSALESQLSQLASLGDYRFQHPPRLDDPHHPDHEFYLNTSTLVYQLDEQHKRNPDQRSNNLASALTVAAREAGLERIDKIALSDDASAVWGVQRPPGVRDGFFDKHCRVGTVEALGTPMEESGRRWMEIMESRQTHQAQEPAHIQAQARVNPANDIPVADPALAASLRSPAHRL